MINQTEFDIALLKNGMSKQDYIKKSQLLKQGSFYSKYNGQTEWTIPEVCEAIRLLKLSSRKARTIFLLPL